jgi:RNA polymerase sigma factor (sigma-70 family)
VQERNRAENLGKAFFKHTPKSNLKKENMKATQFDQQIANLRPTLRGFSHHFTRDKEECLDLVQDTLLKALTYRDSFRVGTNLKGWLFTIMRNTYINGYRKSKHERTLKDNTRELYFLNVEDTHTFNRPSESLEFKEVWRSVNAVREELLIPFKMHATGYKYHEIAEHMKLPIGTIKNRIFHARKEIQKRLAGYL